MIILLSLSLSLCVCFLSPFRFGLFFFHLKKVFLHSSLESIRAAIMSLSGEKKEHN